MQVLVNRGGFRPIHTTLPSTRFPTTHRATHRAKPNKTKGRVARGRNAEKEFKSMATATYMPIRKSGGKPHRTAAQRAATKRMIAGNRASRRSNMVTLGGLDRVPKGAHARSGKHTVKGGKYVRAGTKTTAYKAKPRAKSATAKKAKRASSGKKPRSAAQRAATKRMLAARAISLSTGGTYKAAKKSGKKSSKKSSPRRSNSGGRFLPAHPKTKTITRTKEVLVHKTKRLRNPVGFDDRDGFLRLGTWGKVGVSVLFGLLGLLVSFGVPKGLAMLTGWDSLQRGWGGVATAAAGTIVVSVGAGFLVGLMSKPMGKKVALGLLAACAVGVAVLGLGAALGKSSQTLIPVNEAVLASMLPATGGASAPAPSGSQVVKAPLFNVPGVGLTTMDPTTAANMGLQPVGMGQITYYPAAPSGAGNYPNTGKATTHYPAGSAGYNAPMPGAVGTPNAQAYERAAGQTSGPQGYNAPAPGAVSTADSNVRYSSTTKEKF